MMEWVSLHTHSTFSYGDGYGTVSQHVSRVAKLGMKALALTEHGNVSSWVQLEIACRTAGIKPIFGCEIYCASPNVVRKTHMILLAMNSVGLQNLNRIVTESWKTLGTTSKSKFPTVHFNVLKEFNEGIIALSGCSDSFLSCTLLGGKSYGEQRLELHERDLQRGIKVAELYAKVFGDRYYLEVQRFPGLERTCILNPAIARISEFTGIKMAATADVHYPHPKQNAIQKILHAASRSGSIEVTEASWEYNILLTYPLSDNEIHTDLENTGLSFGQTADAILNTKEIAERCNVELPKANPPKYVGSQRDSAACQELGTVDPSPEDLLRWYISNGWKKRIKYNQHMRDNKVEYALRMKHEYGIICAREGFADYFLMVMDLVKFAKDAGIAVGPGRGSSVGSLVCYLLEITEIDSMQFPVLFERFLDETRTDPPDIDIDFEDERRDEVFEYAAKKYGADRVSNIGTVTRYKGKNSLDDVGRVHHIPKWKIDAIKDKLLERAEGHPRFAKSLMDTYNSFPDIASLIDATPELRFAARLEGNIRNFGVHAAGMVISSVPINEICATYEKRIGERQGNAIAFDKYDATYLGLLKIDALSLNTLGMLAEICRLAGMTLQELYRIPLDDKETLEAFAKGDVLGVFQFEGVTTRRILKDVAPTTFMHLSDVNALARPGAEDRRYIAHKNAGSWTSTNPVLDQHLSWTYGVIVYEEQILMILRDLGGFAPQELNRMRKIIHDKLGGTAFNEHYQRFVKGAARQGVSEDSARKIWDAMVNASGYAFNVAHSVSYSHIGYWAQWLRINYPPQFFTGALLQCDKMSDVTERETKRAKIIQEAERHGIDVLPPKILESQEKWTIIEDWYQGPAIIAGFNIVPGLGPKRVESIMNWRREAKAFEPQDDWFPEWDDLTEIPGIGPKTVATIKEFADAEDPFKTGHIARVLNEVRRGCATGQFDLPTPTHISIDVPKTREWVVFTGLIRKRKYYDAAIQLTKKEIDLSEDEALKRIKDPHLRKYVAFYVEDEYGEQVRISVNRWIYPKFQKRIEEARMDKDIIHVQGYSSDFQGISIDARKLSVLEP